MTTLLKTKPSRLRNIQMKHYSWVVALVLIVLPLLGSCNELAEWRDNQIKTSHDLVNANKLIPPDPPITIPSKIANQLPWKADFVAITYSAERGEVLITALAPEDTLITTKWMLTRLAQLGYDSGDNPSRILEGVEYTSDNATYGSLYVKVTMNVHEQCSVELRAYEVEDENHPSR